METPMSSCCHGSGPESVIKLLEISPSGKILVCTFDDQKEIFVKILNEQTADDLYDISSAKIESSRAPFMPIYFDYDYIKSSDII
jgi:hypothetical protein